MRCWGRASAGSGLSVAGPDAAGACVRSFLFSTWRNNKFHIEPQAQDLAAIRRQREHPMDLMTEVYRCSCNWTIPPVFCCHAGSLRFKARLDLHPVRLTACVASPVQAARRSNGPRRNAVESPFIPDTLLERFHGDWKRGPLAAAKQVVGDRAKHGHDT